MPKRDMFVVLGVVTLLVAALVVWGIRDGKTTQTGIVEGAADAAIVYYYGAECPHCQRVAEFLEENKVSDKVAFTKKEVWHDAANNREMNRRAKESCGLEPDALGVPFLIGDGKCFVGEVEVTDFFKEKSGVQ